MKIQDLFESNQTDTSDNALYRGTKRHLSGVVPFRFRKKSTDTFLPFHNELNRLSEEKFGLPIRSLLFVSPDIEQAIHYGTVYEIVPNGEYRLFVNEKVNDYTADLFTAKSDIMSPLTRHLGRRLGPYFKTDERVKTTMPLKHLVRDIDDDTSLKEYTQNLSSAIIDKFSTEALLDDIVTKEWLVEIIDSFFTDEINTKKFLEDYINNTKEIHIEDVHKYPSQEMMLYSPDGYAVK